MKIGTKVSLMTSLLIVLIVTGISGVLFYSEKKVLVAEIQNRHLTLLNTFRQAAEESLATKDDILLLNYMKLLRKTEGLSAAMVLKRDGAVLAHTDTARWGMALTDAATREILSADGPRQRMASDEQGRPVMDMVLPVGPASPEVLVRIAFSKEFIDGEIRAAMRQHEKRILLIAAAALLFGLGLSLALAQTFLRPIRRLTEATAILGKGKLDHTITVDSKDELGALARDFNVMAARLLELDQMKKDFVSSVTHEFRSPLHSTGMYLGLFQKGGAGELTEKQLSYLKVIEQNTVRLSRFVDDLLDTAKIERGKLEVVKQEFSLAELLKDVQAMFQPNADQRKISYELPTAEGLPKLMGDPDRTRQILTNLLSNAFKFTPEGGRIAVGVAVKDGFAAVSVQDSGLGIPADQLEKIFDKFEQVKGAPRLTGQPKGTGLGLAIVKGLVELQGGKISVTSELQKGSCFTFTVPIVNS
ncbi:MAG TPA: ATP-binding protein [Elusimicrobiota bacterium]|nr:ATP-binding protein [Elusimicrobiota bacterium]